MVLVKVDQKIAFCCYSQRLNRCEIVYTSLPHEHYFESDPESNEDQELKSKIMVINAVIYHIQYSWSTLLWTVSNGQHDNWNIKKHNTWSTVLHKSNNRGRIDIKELSKKKQSINKAIAKE